MGRDDQWLLYQADDHAQAEWEEPDEDEQDDDADEADGAE